MILNDLKGNNSGWVCFHPAGVSQPAHVPSQNLPGLAEFMALPAKKTASTAKAKHKRQIQKQDRENNRAKKKKK
jgi:hypothetical protein